MTDIIGTSNGDTLAGSEAADRIFGKGGDDLLFGLGGDDSLSGGDGADALHGGSGDDTLVGGAGDDFLAGDDGNNSLYGGGGDDVIVVNNEARYAQQISRAGFADGGAGHNEFYVNLTDLRGDRRVDFSGLKQGELIKIGGFGLVNFDSGHADFGAGNDTVSVGDLAIEIDGGEGDDRITGGAAANLFSGGEGDDTLRGGEGDDTLVGGYGSDRLYGGGGADHLAIDGQSLALGGSGDDVLFASGYGGTIDGGQGFDTLTLDLSQAIEAPDIDLRHIQNEATLAFSDSSLDIHLARIEAVSIGLSGLGERINVGDVDATITGGAGDDWIKAEHGWLAAYGGTGDDTINGGSGPDFLNGNDGDDVVRGGAGNDSISGGDGRDRLFGGSGDDHFFIYREGFDSSPDVISGGAGADVFQYASLIDGRITDLQDQDGIDLSWIDADPSTLGDDAFQRVEAFDGHAGELLVKYHAKHDVTLVELDVDGDQVADMTLTLDGDHRDYAGFVL